MSKNKYAFRVAKSRTNSGLVVADSASAAALAKMKHGDLVFAQIAKPRNPGFHRFAHALGKLVSENIERFSGVDPHQCLKLLQIESGVSTDVALIRVKGLGMVEHRTPQSLSFESMSEYDFRDTMVEICSFISVEYWPRLSPEEISNMAEAMVE